MEFFIFLMFLSAVITMIFTFLAAIFIDNDILMIIGIIFYYITIFCGKISLFVSPV